MKKGTGRRSHGTKSRRRASYEREETAVCLHFTDEEDKLRKWRPVSEVSQLTGSTYSPTPPQPPADDQQDMGCEELFQNDQH